MNDFIQDFNEYKDSAVAVIASWNAQDIIEQCIDSLENNQLIYKVIVVDNNSEDGTANLVQGSPKVILLQQEKNLGFGKANNIGIQEALSRFPNKNILLVNQDAYIDSENLMFLTRAMNRNKYNILSPLHLNQSLSAFDPSFFKVLLLQTANTWISDLMLNRRVDEVYESNLVNAAIWLVSPETFVKYGVFDSMFSHYGEDNEYSLRVSYFGGKVGVVPSAKAVHLRYHSKSTHQNNAFLYDLQRKTNRFTNGNLVLLTNKNNSLKRALLEVFRITAREILKCFFKGDFRIVISRLLGFNKTLFFSFAVLKSRSMKLEDYSLSSQS